MVLAESYTGQLLTNGGRNQRKRRGPQNHGYHTSRRDTFSARDSIPDDHQEDMTTAPGDFPSIDAIRANRARLGDLVVTTPVRQLVDDAVSAAVGASTRVWLKEELFQRTGSFKPRGALSVMLDLDEAALARGVTGVSAGNHAISLGYSARILGTTAKVVMPKTANAFRIQKCLELGVEVELVDNITEALERVKRIEAEEGRTFVHPYEGPKTAMGTGSVGMEFMDQVRTEGATLDAVIVAAGGGGLTGGVSCAVKQMSPAPLCTSLSRKVLTLCTEAFRRAHHRPSQQFAQSPTHSAHRDASLIHSR